MILQLSINMPSYSISYNKTLVFYAFPSFKRMNFIGQKPNKTELLILQRWSQFLTEIFQDISLASKSMSLK